MLREAKAGDEADIEAFLAEHPETSMFLRGNLRQFGLSGSDDPRATEYWLCEKAGRITAVFGLSKAGFGMCQAPHADKALWEAFAAAIAGRKLAGITGEAGQVERARVALGLTDAEFVLDTPEPLYRLSLDKLIVPNGLGALRAPTPADRALLTDWHAAYLEELRMTSPERRDEEARERAERSIRSGESRLLIVEDRPVAHTAFNSRLPDMVQIGGVYTPPALRGRGYARRAVALHLAEARAQGVKTAILFASGPAACRAYEAIGFERIGDYTLAILKAPVVIGGRE